MYYLSAFTMLPDLDASFVLNYLKNPTPDNIVRVALDLLLHDDDTPLLNIDPEQTLDPTPNDYPTSEVPSPINSQSSQASLPNIVVPYQNDRGSSTLHYDDRGYTLKYAPKLKWESTWRCVSRTCSRKHFVKQHGHLSTCTPRH